MADREVFSTSVMRLPTGENIDYIVSVFLHGIVVGEINEFVAGLSGSRAKVCISDGKDGVPYTGVIVERKKCSDGCDDPGLLLLLHGRYIMSATNSPDLDVERYAGRRGIETGYRMV